MLFAFLSIIGITWGLPSRKIDKYLFGDGEVWPGEKIYRLAKASDKFSPMRGADVDVDPIGKGADEPIPLTATEEDVAKIYLRYRLYTYQPDEMITMMALAGMRPGKLDLDPRLYQYGGLFIYPVGALIKLCGMLGLIGVRSDVVYYLDNPDEFGKFYIVARAYSAAWGLIGVIVVYGIARRITNHHAGLLAALLFTLMPVVVCMAHEGKPHLPGAVLMLWAVYFAMRFVQSGTAKIEDPSSKIEKDTAEADVGNWQSAIGNRQFFWWMCICCGAALGMVLSSWPIFVLIPLVAFRAAGFSPRDRAIRILTGTAVAMGVYFVTNPYIVINAFVNREVLRSNFGNSLAMYEIARIGEGFIRVLELTVEGATLPVVVLGAIAFVAGLIRKNRIAIPLVAVAVVFFIQFVLIGAGKPAEYGRFGVFFNTALVIGTACFPASSRTRALSRVCALALLLAWVGGNGAAYARNFQIDATDQSSRLRFADYLTTYAAPLKARGTDLTIVVPADPAPYNLPPLSFHTRKVLLVESHLGAVRGVRDAFWWLIHPVDSTARSQGHSDEVVMQEMVFDGKHWGETAISWANKPFIIENTVAVGDPSRP